MNTSATKIKVVVFSGSPLNKRWLNMYHLDELQYDFDIEYCDLSALAYPPIPIEGEIERAYVYKVTSLSQLKSYVRRLPKDTLAFMHVLRNKEMYPVHKIIRSKINYPLALRMNIQIKREEPPYVKHDIQTVTLKHRIKQYIQSHKWLKHCYIFVRHGKKAYQLNDMQELYTYDDRWYLIGCSDEAKYKINHADMDVILKAGEPQKVENPYIVFIDTYYPYHPDIMARFPNADIDSIAKRYYQSMQNFFDKLEEVYHCEIIVAAHPTSVYKDDTPYGENRKCIRYKTVELVRDSLAVCTHNSNTLNVITYYDKPLAMITNDAFDTISGPGSFKELGQALASIIHFPIINIDHRNDVHDMFEKVPASLRKDYIRTYLGDIDHPISNAELIKQHLLTIHQDILKRI